MSEKRTGHPQNVLPSGMTLRGKIEGSEELTVAGTIDGEVHLRGTLHLLEGGRLCGTVSVWRANIAGRTEGVVMASDRAEIAPTAEIEGEVRARRLVVAEGALVNGRLVAGPPESHLSKYQLIEEAVQWEEARRRHGEDGGAA